MFPQNKKMFLIYFIYFLPVLIIVVGLNTNFALAQKQAVSYKDTRDPFIALVTDDGRLLKLERKSSGPMEVEGIIYDAHGLSYIIVKGDVFGIGDWVGEYQLYKIEKNRVVFLKEGEETEVLVKEEE
jgi:hypothetical protein